MRSGHRFPRTPETFMRNRLIRREQDLTFSLCKRKARIPVPMPLIMLTCLGERQATKAVAFCREVSQSLARMRGIEAT
jgi:hypothetical protein